MNGVSAKVSKFKNVSHVVNGESKIGLKSSCEVLILECGLKHNNLGVLIFAKTSHLLGIISVSSLNQQLTLSPPSPSLSSSSFAS